MLAVRTEEPAHTVEGPGDLEIEAAGGGAGAADDEREHQLRERLAQAPEAREVLELVALLCDDERHADALAVLDRALASAGDEVALRVARAGVQRDLGRRHEAARELTVLCREHGAKAVHPGLLAELAEIEWLEGRRDVAGSWLDAMEQAHSHDAWLVANRGRVEELRRALRSEAAPARIPVRDSLACLRGAQSAAVRIAHLDLLAGAGSDGAAAGGAGAADAVRERAIAIGCGDPDPAVRARAVLLARPEGEWCGEFFAVALSDASPAVRCVAAARAVDCMQRGALPLLLARLRDEVDATALAVLDQELARATGMPALLAPGTTPDPSRQDALRATWRQRCHP